MNDFATYLIRNRIFTEDQIQYYLELAEQHGKTLEDILVQDHYLSPERFERYRSDFQELQRTLVPPPSTPPIPASPEKEIFGTVSAPEKKDTEPSEEEMLKEMEQLSAEKKEPSPMESPLPTLLDPFMQQIQQQTEISDQEMLQEMDRLATFDPFMQQSAPEPIDAAILREMNQLPILPSSNKSSLASLETPEVVKVELTEEEVLRQVESLASFSKPATKKTSLENTLLRAKQDKTKPKETPQEKTGKITAKLIPIPSQSSSSNLPKTIIVGGASEKNLPLSKTPVTAKTIITAPASPKGKTSAQLPIVQGTHTGEPIESRYELLEALGEGGMGVVQRVKDRILGREVALKKIKAMESHLNEMQQMMLWRLKREAEITAVLEHPNIVPLYDMGKSLSGELHFTMRKITGETLSHLFRSMRQELKQHDESKLLSIFLKVCDAVSYAHSQGIIHRDLKPDNVMVGRFGEVYVMDWGIAKSLGESSGGLITVPQAKNSAQGATDVQTIGGIGTPGYMPPEQEENANQVKASSDVYALGVMLRECYTLLSPAEEFKLEMETERKKRKLAKHKKKLKETGTLDEQIPSEILAIVQKATAEKPQDRYPRVDLMLIDIENYQKNRRVSVKEYTPLELLWKWANRHRKTLAISFGFLSLLIALVFTDQWRKRKEQQQQFDNFYQQAHLEQTKGERPENKGTPAQLQKLFKALTYFNEALSVKPFHAVAEQEKWDLGKQLIQLACSAQNYQLANYIAKEMSTISFASSQEKDALQAQVEEERTKLLKQHQQQLTHWISELKKPIQESGTTERARLEISKMREPEIFDQLVALLEEGTRYYLTDPNRSTFMDEFYQTFAEILGSLQNPKAGNPLLSSLLTIHKAISQFPLREKPVAEIQYMVALTQAIVYSKATGFARAIYQIRQDMGHNSLFWKRTNLSFKILSTLDGLEKVETTTAADFVERGLLKHENGEYTGAIEDFTKAIELNPKSVAGYSNRGNAKVEIRDFSGAIEDFNQAIQIEPQASFYVNRGNAKQAMGNFLEALQDYDRAIQMDAKISQAYNSRGNCKNRLGRFKEAITDYSEAIRLNQNYVEAYMNRAGARSDSGDIKGSLDDYNYALSLNPQFAELYMNRGLLKLELKDTNGALSDFEQTIRLKPQFSEGYFNRARIKSDKKDLDGALADYDQAIRLNPQPHYYFNRGGTKLKKKDRNAAREDYKKYLELTKNIPDPQGLRSWIFTQFPELNK